jgi:hypothetical protein
MTVMLVKKFCVSRMFLHLRHIDSYYYPTEEAGGGVFINESSCLGWL